MKEDKLYKALETISLGYSRGNLPVDMLITACDRYKEKSGFNDDYDYQLLVSKSCYDHLNEVKQDAEIVKAILPGQTKVIDGVLYVWSQTKPGSKDPYDWHVVSKVDNKGAITKVGKGDTLDDTQRNKATNYVNDLFPKDLSSLNVVKRLGGSTGAELVTDAKGREFVKKVGQGSREGHVQVEYFANQIYELLGFKAKTCELYNEGKDGLVLLSTFERGLNMPTTKDYKKMSEGFILDVLLANWDVYQNDNCLVDAAGNIHRIDNGGVFDYKAQGRIDPKKFTEDVVETFNGMVRFNGNIYQYLDENDLHNQINAIKSKKDEIVAYMKLSGLDDYAKIMEKRINNLDNIFLELNKGKGLTNIPIKPRVLKSDSEMYRDITDEELTEIRDAWCGANGVSYDNSLKYKDKTKHGWELLNEICESRGFTGRPQVVTEDEFWKLKKNGDGQHLCFRGVGASKDAKVTSEMMAKNTMFEDRCFYGTIGAYGEGIYAAEDKKSSRVNYKGNWSFGEARSYSKSNGGSDALVMKLMLDKSAKIIDFNTLQKEAGNYVFDSNKNVQLISVESKKLSKIGQDLLDIDNEIRNFSTKIEDEVNKEFNYDPVSLATLQMELDDIDWDKKDISGDPDTPSYNEVVEKMIVPYMKSIGADIYKGKGLYRFTIKNSNETITISEHQYENAVRKKNQFSPSYNHTVNRFTDYVQRELVKKVEDEVKRRQDSSSDKLQDLIDKRSTLQTDYHKQENILDNLRTNGSRPSTKDSFLAQVTGSNAYGELLGLYAAAKGYDAIKVDSANYMVILNRTKVIISNEVDYV